MARGIDSCSTAWVTVECVHGQCRRGFCHRTPDTSCTQPHIVLTGVSNAALKLRDTRESAYALSTYLRRKNSCRRFVSVGCGCGSVCGFHVASHVRLHTCSRNDSDR